MTGKDKKMTEVSVIIPVYNVETYLKRCLDSVIDQTFKLGYEVICVNDGSTDNSLRILNDYAKKFPQKFKIIHQKNKGASVARNVALENASGKYTMFVDADDFVAKNALELLYNFAEKHNSEVVFFDFYKGIQGSNQIYRKHYDKLLKDFGDSSFNIDTAEPYIFKDVAVAPWCKFYLTDFARKIKFVPGVINEDVCHWCELYTSAQKINYYPEPLYFYVDNIKNSVTTYSGRIVFDAFKVFSRNEKMLKERGYFEKLKDCHYILFASWLIGAAKKIYPVLREELIEKIKKYDMDINFDNILNADYHIIEKQDVYFVKVVRENDFDKIEEFCLQTGIWQTKTPEKADKKSGKVKK